MNKIFVFNTKEAVATFAIKKWAEISTQSVGKRGNFSVALSGGKTPRDFYRKLGRRNDLPWDRTHIFLVDERYVPFEDEASNFRLLKETLLKNSNLSERNIHPILTGEDTPQTAAKKYEADLNASFGLTEDELPLFDLIMLGIGEDGHTASLFPGSSALAEEGHLAVAVNSRQVKNKRISLTLPVINNTKNIIFLVAGENKAKVIKEILEKNNPQLPASLVNSKHGEVLFLLDKNAASLVADITSKKNCK